MRRSHRVGFLTQRLQLLVSQLDQLRKSTVLPVQGFGDGHKLYDLGRQELQRLVLPGRGGRRDLAVDSREEREVVLRALMVVTNLSHHSDCDTGSRPLGACILFERLPGPVALARRQLASEPRPLPEPLEV